MAFTTNKLDDAVAAFKAIFAGDPDLYLSGQFYLTNRYLNDILSAVRTDLQAQLQFILAPELVEPTLGQFRSLLEGLLDPIRDATSLQIIAQSLAQLAQTLVPDTVLTGMFTPGAPDVAGVKTDHNTVWSPSSVAAAPPFLTTTVRKFMAARPFEKDNCFVTCTAFARKLQTARAIPTVQPANRISDGQVAQATVTRLQDPASGIASDVVQFNPTQLSPLSGRLKAAITAHAVLRCGVLSGAFHEQSVFPIPEHFILVFDFDVLDSTDVFVFWDPDAAVTQVAGVPWGRAFDLLFAGSSRISTARDDADLFRVETDKNKTLLFGSHLGEPLLRHRYQPYSFQTLPQ